MAACVLAMTFGSSAEAADVDWKLYGGASVTVPSFCFYDAGSTARTSSGYIRLWTKCLAQKDLDGVDMKDDVGRKIVDSAARKIKEGYVPPIVGIGKMDFKEIAGIVAYEETANLGGIEPEALIFEELDCANRMRRSLSISIHVNGRSVIKDEPGE
jgi:hypothetical protein